jgi:hypothetical protein
MEIERRQSHERINSHLLRIVKIILVEDLQRVYSKDTSTRHNLKIIHYFLLFSYKYSKNTY